MGQLLTAWRMLGSDAKVTKRWRSLCPVSPAGVVSLRLRRCERPAPSSGSGILPAHHGVITNGRTMLPALSISLPGYGDRWGSRAPLKSTALSLSCGESMSPARLASLPGYPIPAWISTCPPREVYKRMDKRHVYGHSRHRPRGYCSIFARVTAPSRTMLQHPTRSSIYRVLQKPCRVQGVWEGTRGVGWTITTCRPVFAGSDTSLVLSNQTLPHALCHTILRTPCINLALHHGLDTIPIANKRSRGGSGEVTRAAYSAQILEDKPICAILRAHTPHAVRSSTCQHKVTGGQTRYGAAREIGCIESAL